MARPVAIISDGMLKVVWVPVSVVETAPTLAELNHANTVDLSCYLTPDGFNFAADEQMIADDRLCDTQSFDRIGRHKYTLALRYVRGATPGTDDKAYETLTYLTDGFIVARYGLPFAGIFVLAQKVTVIPVECGLPIHQAPEANSALKVMQTMAVRSVVTRDYSVPAA